jgi:hypothetical protein
MQCSERAAAEVLKIGATARKVATYRIALTRKVHKRENTKGAKMS